MKVSYTTTDNRKTFEADVPNMAKSIQFIADIQEIFEEASCGCCKSSDIKCQAKPWQDGVILNLMCRGCGAQLDIGQRKEGGGLWIKRTDKDGAPKGVNGWYRYQRQSGGYADSNYSSPAQTPAPAATDDPDSIPF